MLRRQKAFTLIELMVVVSIIALLAAMLLPALQRALEQTRRASCMNNLKGAGTALGLYSQNNDNTYPLLPGTSWDNTIDGTTWLSSKSVPTGVVATDWAVTRSVSSLVFMLIRNGEAPKLFVCPSDSYAKPDTQTTDTNNNGAYNWDFSCGQTIAAGGGTAGSGRNLSYSYQCPIYRGTGAQDTNGIPTNADSSMVVMADRTPNLSVNASNSGVASAASAFNGASTPVTAWASTVTSNNLHCYNSQNHSSGEMMNVLYVDGHAAAVRNPNVGATQNNNTGVNAQADCIFTVTNVTTVSTDGIDYGGTCDNTKHLGNRDTYLWGAAGK